eukprot:gene5071-56652_t
MADDHDESHPEAKATVVGFNISRALFDWVAPGDEVVLKIDAEGAEYCILASLLSTGHGVAPATRVLIVEFHSAGTSLD